VAASGRDEDAEASTNSLAWEASLVAKVCAIVVALLKGDVCFAMMHIWPFCWLFPKHRFYALAEDF